MLLEAVAQDEEAGRRADETRCGRAPAVSAGMSRKSYWHLAKTEAINVGLSNAYLKEQGLTSIRTLWIKIHYPATAR